MALYGSSRDISFFKGRSHEIINNIISQQIGYYKVMLSDTKPNVYGESLTKNYIGPVLINCLIKLDNYSTTADSYGPDVKRSLEFRFLKDDLISANVVPEVGDIVMYNELYYAVDLVNENQYILGKNPDYSYTAGLENYGSTFSVVLFTHYTSADSLGINLNKL
jgi:hypothetical protein